MRSIVHPQVEIGFDITVGALGVKLESSAGRQFNFDFSVSVRDVNRTERLRPEFNGSIAIVDVNVARGLLKGD